MTSIYQTKCIFFVCNEFEKSPSQWFN